VSRTRTYHDGLPASLLLLH